MLSLADPNLGALRRQKRQQKFNTASSRRWMMRCEAMGSWKGKNKRRSVGHCVEEEGEGSAEEVEEEEQSR